ncbi:mechanosensitive ion channel domain-containing protein [Shewanella sp. GXUN23E]|uniref:mechanosensitive ion channel domain-containing protein n=1 Tax=Shewanella sp. GXUN23E TaxID=3422498 RepID=UPI003D7EF77B
MEKWLLVLCYIAGFYLAQRQLKVWVGQLARFRNVGPARVALVVRFLTGLLLFVTVSLIAVTFGLGYQDVSLFVSSIFAVLGVALIAQWSILSNLTAGILIFFVFPYRIGERIKVVDKDEDISGEIREIALFHVLIVRDNGDLITYPNSLMLQKPVLKLAAKSPDLFETRLPAQPESKSETQGTQSAAQ